MRLPHRDRIDLGPSPYEQFLQREAIPVIKGYFIEDLMALELKPWERMGALGCYLNLGEQQETDKRNLTPAPPLRNSCLYRDRSRGDDRMARGKY
ncbi:MAG: hypothetical protein E6J89_16955 [Deltaproteobacteria bacterium]|nr:MAG: hypothetical protein E6J89_16955 [Deltaproteobacteria bacterium]